jgi:hypothetical protein
MTESEILNIGLDLAMEWGEYWLTPIQERLKKQVSFLTKAQLDNYNNICKSTMDDCHKYLYTFLEKLCKENKRIKNSELNEQWNTYVTSKYVWINENNLSHLFSQGMYYSWKDGLIDCIID